ncbi:MAG: hypothetical protein FWC46_01775 [Actinomycetia bacterium]|nr:hypothetical protein [Actinomycetes bacterium]
MLSGSVVPVTSLTGDQTDTMYALMARHYDHLDRDTFLADLAAKSDVILLRDPEGTIGGFSTLAVLRVSQSVQLVFSGDTVVDHTAWGRHDLTRTWIGYAFERAASFQGRTYWLLMSKGWKTYRYLPMTFLEFYPRRGTTTPPAEAAIIDGFATRYGARYVAGVLKPDKDRVKPEYSQVPETARQDPDIAFFLEANPGHEQGDELVCLALIAPENLTAMGLTLLNQAG